jgi:hypothetical protein
LLGAIGGFGTGMRMARIGPAVGRTQGPLSTELREQLRSSILLMSLRVRLAIVLGVVFLMTVKPSGVASLAVMLVALALGLLAGQIPARRRSHELRTDVG